MGLFGGFKAKFTRNSKNKDNVQTVICTKYHVFSEFDAPSNSNGSVPSQPAVVKIPASRQRPIRPKRPLIKSEIIDNHVSFEPLKKSESLQNINNIRPRINTPPPDFSPPALPKSRPPPLIHNDYEEPIDDNSLSIATTVELPTNSRSLALSETSIGRNHTRQINGELEDSLELTTVNTYYSSGSDFSMFGQKTNSLKSFTTHDDYEEMSPGDEPSTLIFMTQHSTASESSNKHSHSVHNKPDYGYDEKTMYIPDRQTYDSTYDDEEFTVNIVKHDKKRNYSVSEDEISNLDVATEDSYDYTAMGYSSHASNIFFGGDMNPLSTRTRVLALKQDNDEDEEDC